MKNSKFPTLLILITLIFGGSYIHGARIITLEEIPSSHRPWQIYLSADYAQAHLSESKDYLSELR